MVPTYILTIDSEDGDRYRHALRECDRLGLVPHFVKGARVGDRALDRLYSRWRNLLYLKRSLTPGEIACYEGHRRCWAAVAAGKDDVALICEDDFYALDAPRLQAALRDCLRRTDWDVLKFFDFAPKKILRRVDVGSVAIVDYKYAAAGMVCYLIRKSAAKRALARKRIFRPVDEDFLYCWEFGIRVRSVFPNLVAETAHTLGGSLLEADRARVKHRKNYLRSFWGMFLTIAKQINARRYLKAQWNADGAPAK